MSVTKPFLFLDSPRVAEIGHSYLVSPQTIHPPENLLVSLSTRARNRGGDMPTTVSAVHRVKQSARGMVREGDEWLICGGAEPVRAEDWIIVISLLERLLESSLPAPDIQLIPGREIAPLVFEAAFLQTLTDAFEADATVRGMQWKPTDEGLPQPKHLSVDSDEKETWWDKMKTPWIVLCLVVAFLTGLVLFGRAAGLTPSWLSSRMPESRSNPAASPAPSPTPPPWEFLANDEWRTLRGNTGGDDFDPKSETAKAKHWSDQLTLEWLVEQPANPGAFEKDARLCYARDAKEPWFEDKRNQLTDQKDPALQRLGGSLHEFSGAFPKGDVYDLREHERALWDAFDVLSRSRVSTDGTPLSALTKKWNNKPADLSAPPSGYKILTPLDAKRLDHIRSVLNSAEFATLVLRHPETTIRNDNWLRLAKFIDYGFTRDTQKDLTIDPDVERLLGELEKAFKAVPKQ